MLLGPNIHAFCCNCDWNLHIMLSVGDKALPQSKSRKYSAAESMRSSGLGQHVSPPDLVVSPSRDAVTDGPPHTTGTSFHPHTWLHIVHNLIHDTCEILELFVFVHG